MIAGHPLHFGRKAPALAECDLSDDSKSSLSADIRLFATTFAVGFLFVSVLIA